MRRSLVSLVSLVVLLTVAACGGRDANTLVVGTEAAFAPFESVGDDGSLEGFDIDLMRAVGAHLGKPLEFRNMEFSALIPDLEGGRIGAICSGLSYTEDRAQVVTFSRPYARVPTGVLVSEAKAGGVTSADELNGDDVVIAVQRKTTGEQKAREAFPKASIRAYDRELDAAIEVASGRAHALVYDMVSIVKLHRQNPETTRIIESELGTELYCIAWPKGSADAASVDAFLAAESRPGGLVDALLEKWLGESRRFRVEEE